MGIICAMWLVLGSDLSSGSLLRPPRLGALPAVPQHPVRALAPLAAVVRAGTAGGAAGALLEARSRGGQARGRYAARAAAPLAESRECLRAAGVLDGATARDVERGGPRGEPAGPAGGGIRAVGESLVEQPRDAGTVPLGHRRIQA